MKLKIRFLIAIFLFMANIAYANPIFTTVDSTPMDIILIYSNNKMNVYIPEIFIKKNIVGSNDCLMTGGSYGEFGAFTFPVFIEVKDELSRQKVINNIRNGIANGQVKLAPQLDTRTYQPYYLDINTVKYIQIQAHFYYDNHGPIKDQPSAVLEGEWYLADDNKIVAIKSFTQIINLSEDKFWAEIASICKNKLDQYPN